MTVRAEDLHLETAPSFFMNTISGVLDATLYTSDGMVEVSSDDNVLFQVRVSGGRLPLDMEIHARQAILYAFGEAGRSIPMKVVK